MRVPAPVLVVTLLVGLVTACAAMLEVSSDYDSNFDFAKLRAYQWLPGKATIPGRDERYSDLLDSRLRAAVDRELATKGYPKAGTKPDFLVTYHLALEDKIDVRVINDYYGGYGYRGYYGAAGWSVPRTETYQYRIGTLIVDVIDAASSKLVWRGTVEGEADVYKDPKKREERLNEAVQKVLAKFPPQPKKK